MVVMMYSVTLTCRDVVPRQRVHLVETGFSLMELDCHSLVMMLVFFWPVQFNELTCIVTQH